MKIMFAPLGGKNKKRISRDDILKSLYGYTYFEKKEKTIKRTNNGKNQFFNLGSNVSNKNLSNVFFKNEDRKSSLKSFSIDLKDRIIDLKKRHEFFNDNISKKSIKHNYKDKNIESKFYNRIYNNDNTNNLNVSKFSLFKSCILTLFVISMLFFAIENIGLVKENIFEFATNLFVDDEEINPKELMKLYGIYNDSNYVLNNEKVEVAVVEENKVEKEIEVVSSEIALIDKCANIEDKAVFMNTQQKPQAVITEQTSSLQRITLGTMKILNYSSTRNINFEELLNKNITLTKASDNILLYNTHTSESYTNSEGYQFEYSGTMRSMDANYNMLAIAKELNNNLLKKGFNSIQNTTPHDYGTYTSAYAKSRATVQDALSQMQGAGIIIDVHRDASANLAYRPVANVNGVQVCQLMFVMGVGSSSVANPNWKDNLALALKIQLLAGEIYPGLFRPMIIRNSVYNQDLNKYAMLVEFGATGNTIEEVKLSTRCLTNLLNIIYKD